MELGKGARLPVDIPLREEVLLEGGAMFTRLPTLHALTRFWSDNKATFTHACECRLLLPTPTYLRPYEWVFATSKVAAVRTVMRWGRSDISCEFFDFAAHHALLHAQWFESQAREREARKAMGIWTAFDEAAYARRTPANYRGWWRLTNLPDASELEQRTSAHVGLQALADPQMPAEEAAHQLHEQIFNRWMRLDAHDIQAYDRGEMAEMLRFEHRLAQLGGDYYGMENEGVGTTTSARRIL